MCRMSIALSVTCGTTTRTISGQELTMDYASLGSMWDITQAPSQFSQLPDDDFLALLHKQFSPGDAGDRSVNPQSVQKPQQSPTSDDSSPSPPSNTDTTSRRQSVHVRPNDTEDAPLKRKASGDDMEPGPSSKNQHTGVSTSFTALHLFTLYQPMTGILSKSPKHQDANRRATLRFV